MKINLRMNLSDFINQPYEAHVIDKLEEIHKDSVTYYLTLWYADGDVSNEDIKRFLVPMPLFLAKLFANFFSLIFNAFLFNFLKHEIISCLDP